MGLQRTYEDQPKIRDGKVVVMTAEEVIALVEEKVWLKLLLKWM